MSFTISTPNEFSYVVILICEANQSKCFDVKFFTLFKVEIAIFEGQNCYGC